MPYKFSPSSLSLLKECPRCFWMHFNKGIKRPDSIFPSLPSGMDRIKSEMKAYKLDSPKFEYTGVWFIVTFNRPNLQVNSYQKRMGLEIKDTVKLNKSQLKIIEIISRDPNITIEELSAKIHINVRNTKKNISKLKELGNLKRIGSDKTGHWGIVKK